MRVLQINAIYKISSTGRTVFELHEFLQKKGIESYVACADNNGSEEAYLIGGYFEKKFHALMSRLSGLQGYFSIKGTKGLIRYIQYIRPDIVHLRNLHANYINMSLLLSYLADNDIRTVITLHDCWPYTGKCTHYTIANCSKWHDGCNHCVQLSADNKSWFFDQTLRMWEDKKKWFEAIPRLAVIGVSDWVTDEAKKSLLSKAKIIRRIYNWIDLDRFKDADSSMLCKRWGLRDKFVILGIASSWSEKKGLGMFIELAEELDENKRIVLIGDMPECKISSRIIHVPPTNNVEELVSYYSMADVFLQLSYEETFGKVVAEALACGTPVIAINSTANSELISHRCGILLEKPKISDIMRAICEVEIYGKEHYKNLCRKFAVDNFCLDERAMDYVNVYQELMEM